MARNAARPLSPHLTVWKWGPAMLVSILHRATGTALAIGGGLFLICWLVALASGATAYATFLDYVTADDGRFNVFGLNWLPALILVGLTWAFFQHFFSGLRHLLLDTGAGYELKTNKFWSIATIVGSLLCTVLVWVSLATRH